MDPLSMHNFFILHTPISAFISLRLLCSYINDILENKVDYSLDSTFYIYVNKKKYPLKGRRTLYSLGVKYTMQIIIAK